VTLRPKIAFGGPSPDPAKLEALHHEAHELCFIANSVITKIEIEPQ
jgi:organic hydroperoxide reductase OsmC/OhrA